MFCQVDRKEADIKLNPTVRNNEGGPILLFFFLWDICQKSKEIVVIHTPMDHGWGFSYHSYKYAIMEFVISHFLSELGVPI